MVLGDGGLEDLDDRAVLVATRCNSSTARCTLWVPNTTSTWPARRWTSSRSFWARQPPTMISSSGRRSLLGLQVTERAVELVVGVLADAARVEHHDVGVVDAVGRRPCRRPRAARRCARSRARSSDTRRCGPGTAWSPDRSTGTGRPARPRDAAADGAARSAQRSATTGGHRGTGAQSSVIGRSSGSTSSISADRASSTHADARRGPDLLGDLDHDLGVLDQERLGVLTALAELLALVGVPSTRLLHDAQLDRRGRARRPRG